MSAYLIRWNTGYGDSDEVVEAASQEEADKIAYEAWKEEAESQAYYSAEVMTDELREEWGL